MAEWLVSKEEKEYLEKLHFKDEYIEKASFVKPAIGGKRYHFRGIYKLIRVEKVNEK